MSPQDPRPYKIYKFEMGGSYIYYSGRNLGEAILNFLQHRPTYMPMVQTITEEGERQ